MFSYNNYGKVIHNAKVKFALTHPDVPFLHLHHPGSDEPAENGYFKLSKHFKWALNKVKYFRSSYILFVILVCTY